MNWSAQRVAFIGTGQMATALATGFTRELLQPSQIAGFDPSEQARLSFRDRVGQAAGVYADLGSALTDATIVVLAVKPQVMQKALSAIDSTQVQNAIFVSVAAGVSLQKLALWLPPGSHIIRVMPNTPALVGCGASGVAAASDVTPDELSTVTSLLKTVGIVEVVPEELLDAVTGLSGSGPAYVFQIIEALSDGGVKMGLPRAVATRLASQTLLGAAEMQLSTGQHPAALKDAVTSPGGTTIAGIHALESGGLRAAIINAVEASARRSRELGNG